MKYIVTIRQSRDFRATLEIESEGEPTEDDIADAALEADWDDIFGFDNDFEVTGIDEVEDEEETV